ncbi:MAG TPA: hypothetical protein VMI33_19735 [Streptosporangiaceae bacterium]|nr:hypothetical protein [Streptosporangiaceae bacterium]
MKKPSQFVVPKSRSVQAGLFAAVVAATALTASCSSGPDQRASALVIVERPSTVKHWGSFFGGTKGVNYDLGTSPAALTVPGTVAEIGTSNSTEYALLTNGTVYAWGLGTLGELGNGQRDNSFTKAVRVRFPRGVKIAFIPPDVMPYDSALAVDTKGHVWAWGANGKGEFCLGNSRSYDSPVRLPFSHVTAVAGASNHALFDAGGTVYACGQNIAGDLGDGSRAWTRTPVRVAGLGGAPVRELVASFANSGALLANGDYFDWGYNAAGQVGNGHVGRSYDVPVQVKLPLPVKQVAQGGSIWDNGQTLVMLADGSLWGWGSDWAGQLGDGVRTAQPSPARFSPPPGVTYRFLATGSATSYAVSTTGDVYAWGAGTLGQVGDGSTYVALTPVMVASGAALISATANNVLISVPRRARHHHARGAKGRSS